MMWSICTLKHSLCSYTVQNKFISSLYLEYLFSNFQNAICDFAEKWNAYGVLCKEDNENIDFFCIDINSILFSY